MQPLLMVEDVSAIAAVLVARLAGARARSEARSARSAAPPRHGTSHDVL